MDFDFSGIDRVLKSGNRILCFRDIHTDAHVVSTVIVPQIDYDIRGRVTSRFVNGGLAFIGREGMKAVGQEKIAVWGENVADAELRSVLDDEFDAGYLEATSEFVGRRKQIHLFFERGNVGVDGNKIKVYSGNTIDDTLASNFATAYKRLYYDLSKAFA